MRGCRGAELPTDRFRLRGDLNNEREGCRGGIECALPALDSSGGVAGEAAASPPFPVQDGAGVLAAGLPLVLAAVARWLSPVNSTMVA